MCVVEKNKHIIETLEKNDNIKDGSFIDCYNRKVYSDSISRTISTGVSFRNETFVAEDKREHYLVYAEAGDGSGNIPKVIDNAPKLLGGFGEKKSNGGTQWYQQDRVYDSENVAMCHCANIPSGSYNYQLSDLRIRKLTPCECFKLMGVKPSDYNKITCSNAQKYKQAGNSIVTTCLMAIYSQLFNDCNYEEYVNKLLKELVVKK